MKIAKTHTQPDGTGWLSSMFSKAVVPDQPKKVVTKEEGRKGLTSYHQTPIMQPETDSTKLITNIETGAFDPAPLFCPEMI